MLYNHISKRFLIFFIINVGYRYTLNKDYLEPIVLTIVLLISWCPIVEFEYMWNWMCDMERNALLIAWNVCSQTHTIITAPLCNDSANLSTKDQSSKCINWALEYPNVPICHVSKHVCKNLMKRTDWFPGDMENLWHFKYCILFKISALTRNIICVNNYIITWAYFITSLSCVIKVCFLNTLRCFN